MLGALFMGVYGFVYIALLNTAIPWVVFIAVALSLLPVMTRMRAGGGTDRESFTPPRLRYSGSSLGSTSLPRFIAGGPSPFIATWLFATYRSAWPIAIYIAICAIIGIVATAMLTDYTSKDISAEYVGV